VVKPQVQRLTLQSYGACIPCSRREYQRYTLTHTKTQTTTSPIFLAFLLLPLVAMGFFFYYFYSPNTKYNLLEHFNLSSVTSLFVCLQRVHCLLLLLTSSFPFAKKIVKLLVFGFSILEFFPDSFFLQKGSKRA
jgi:hypothetical protein